MAAVDETTQLPWKVAFRVQFASEKYGLKFHPAALPDTGNGVYTIQLLDVPQSSDPATSGPAQQYNAALKPEQQHLALRAGLYLTHINDTNLLSVPCEEVIRRLTTVPRPVKLRFVDVDAGVVTLKELKQGKYTRDSYSAQQISQLLQEAAIAPLPVPEQTNQQVLQPEPVNPEKSTTDVKKVDASPQKRVNVVAQSNQSELQKPADHVYKLILLGTTGVGKSSLLSVGIGGTNSYPERPAATLEAEFGTIYVTDPDVSSQKMLKAQIWDTAGQERYRAMTRSHYRRADGALLVYDVADPDSFAKLDGWLKDLRDIAGDSIKAIMVVENKVDQLPERTSANDTRPPQFVNENLVKDYCRANGLLFARTSAKMNATAFKWEGQRVSDVVGHLLLNVHVTQLARGLKQQQGAQSKVIIEEPRIVLEDKAKEPHKAECSACASS
ncbi:Rab11 family GTPase [Thraustotheca clavata]|uniref:Rab11 family GTPase n=1 Tax=Thraustotheca clavata TaxID=74557 RepID=A0A1W0AAT7_9STRA|nr:Rab11 family GTPase [Thraustotheca clavata]